MGRQMVIVPYFEREEMDYEALQCSCAGNAKKRRYHKNMLGICGNRSSNDGKEEHISRINNKWSREKIRERERGGDDLETLFPVLPVVHEPVFSPL